MAELINNPLKIKKETGFDIFEDFLFPKLQLASWKMHGPFIVKVGKKEYMFGRMHEKGYFQGKVIPTDLVPTYFTPYFLFEPDDTIVYNNAVEGIIKCIGDEKLIVDFDIPMALYENLNKKVELQIGSENNKKIKGSISKKPINQIEDELNYLRFETSENVSKMIDTLETDNKSVLKQYLELDGKGRFNLLNKYMKSNNLSSIIATSRLNVQELAGVPYRSNYGGVIAIYNANENFVYTITTNEYGMLNSGTSGILDVPGVESIIADGIIGIEEEDMGLGIFTGLGLENKDVVSSSKFLRDWREEWAGNDLQFYIIAGLATRNGIESSLAEAKRRVSTGIPISESEVYNLHMLKVEEYLSKYKIPLTFELYFANLHSGNRSESPSCFKEYEITEKNNTVKFDTGIKLFDNYGYLRAVSDIARTICFNDDAQDVYDMFEKVMLETGIPASKIGASGNDVYMETCKEINNHIGFLKEIKFIPEDIEYLEKIYTRDVGHTVGKEEPANLCFKKDEEKILKEGMVACYEIQWGYKRHSFGTEDSYVITNEGPIIFTR